MSKCSCGNSVLIPIHTKKCRKCLNVNPDNEIHTTIVNSYCNCAGNDSFQIPCIVCNLPNIKCINSPIKGKISNYNETIKNNSVCCDCLIILTT